MAQLNTRLQLKYDSLQNWTTHNPELLSGEIAIVYLGNSHTSTSPDNGTHPILFKVGPGKFNALPFASALAADVYDWAKKEKPDWADIPNVPETKLPVIPGIKLGLKVEDNGTGKFVTDIEYNETTKTFTISRSDVAWEDIKNKPDFGVTKITAQGDEEVSLTVDKSTGEVKITADHEEHAKGSAKNASTPTISGYSAAGTLKIPKIVTNEHGHVTEISEETVSIEMPPMQEFEDTNTVTTVNGSAYIEVTASVNNDTQKNYTVSLKEDEVKKLIGTETTAAMEFKGATSVLPASGAKGDMYKISGAFSVPAAKDAQGQGFSAKIGDSIVYEESGKWYHIPSGDDIEDTWRPVAGVDNDAGLTFTAGPVLDVAIKNNGEIEYSHEEFAAPTKTAGSGRTYLTDITTDGYGHITGFKTASESDQDLSKYKIKQTAVSDKITDKAHVLTSLTQNENGEISYEVKQFSGYDLKECATAKNSSGVDVDCLIFYCGTASDLV